MPDFINEMKSSTYKKEITDTLQRLVRMMPVYSELAYFVKKVRNYYLSDFEKSSPDIVVIGSNIPEELVYAAGKMPYWILGGSRISSLWADDIVPRDTDPVSRASFGYIQSGFAEKSLILIPLTCDSARKQAYILKSMGLKVHTFHFPPLKDEGSIAEWNRQYEACRSAIALHLRKPLTKRMLEKSKEQIRQAKSQIRDFMENSEGVMNGTCRMFIISSYYCADNIAEWCYHLKRLTARAKKERKNRSNEKSKVLLLGSPIYFPDYKVPFLIEEAGLEICSQADYTALSLQSENATDDFYRNDASSAYVKNNSLYEKIVRIVMEKETDGIVYHVLKGQIEYDFELGRFEALFEKLNIPVFRLETDYNYQDVEQLRIRLEAFSEVLKQRKYGNRAVAI